MKNIKKLDKRILMITIVILIIGVIAGWSVINVNHNRSISAEVEETPLKKIEEIAVLSYHMIASDEEKATYYNDNRYVISQTRFDAQMAYLAANKYHALTLEELYDWYINDTPLEENCVVITFDDGYASSKHIAEPILQKYKLPGSTFVIGAKVQDSSVDRKPGQLSYLSKDELQNTEYMRYYSHTYAMHGFRKGSYQMDQATKEEAMADIKSIGELVDNTFFAFPHGYRSKVYDEASQAAGVKLQFSYGNSVRATRESDQYFLPRLDVSAEVDVEKFISLMKGDTD